MLIIAALAALIYSLSLNSRIQVCYELGKDASTITKVYWSAAADFSESRSVGTRVAAGKTRVCLSDPNMRSVAALRIDPADAAGGFQLDNIYIYRLDLLQPWRQLRRVRLAPDQATARQQVEIKAQGGFESKADDPYFIWRLDQTAASGYRVAAFNLVTVVAAVAVLCLICLVPAGQGVSGTLSVWPAAIVFAFFLICLAIAHLVRLLADLWVHADLALYLSLALLAIYLVMFRAWGARPRAAVALAGLAGVMLSTFLDAGYRFGWLDKPVFAKVSHDDYHWRLTRNARENLDNSSIRYYPDFERLRVVLRPGSYFIADLATSYYVGAALPVYPKVMQPHHGRYYALYRDTLAQLCADEPIAQLKHALRATVEDDRLTGGIAPEYVFINKDRVNHNVRNDCLTRNYDRVSKRLESVAERVFKGGHLDVYVLDYERF